MSAYSLLCERCEQKLRLPSEDYCQECYDLLAEQAWERRMENGECFRGGEAAAFEAEQLAKIQREFK